MEEILIKELEDYIEFLGKHVANHEVFMSIRGGYSPDKKAIQEGVKRRKRIKQLKTKTKGRIISE